jgi:hypothetical protein
MKPTMVPATHHIKEQQGGILQSRSVLLMLFALGAHPFTSCAAAQVQA